MRGRLIPSTSEWRGRIAGAAPGDHFLFLTDSPASTDRVLDAYVRGGLDRGDLIALAVPNSELDQYRASLIAAGVDLDGLLARDELVMVPAEDWTSADSADEEAIASFFGALTDLARERNKSGLSFVGRIAPSLLEQGDLERARMTERVLHAARGSARALCPYDTRRVTLERIREMYALLRSHTHTITTLPGERFLIEEVRSDESG